MINGLRVKQAREIRKITQVELAERLQVHKSVIGKMETDVRDWSPQLIEALAFQTGFPVAFFHQGFAPEFPLGSLLFRCRASLPANEKNKIRQFVLLEFEIAERLSERTKPIPLHLPSFNNENPVDAAKVTRTTLGLPPDTPIPNLINKLEKNGVFVFAIPNANEKFDAFSLWSDNDPRKPIVVVNSNKSGDRIRYSCAHELGHLVLHKSPRGNLDEIEKEAHAFAAEFLIPEEAFRREVSLPVTLTDLAKLKPRWGVAIQALIKRAYYLDMLTERQYRYMFEQIGKLGWRTREPANLDIPIERPRLFRKLAELSYGIPPDAEKIASLVNAPVSMVEEILSVHAGKAEMPKQENGQLSTLLTPEKPENKSENNVLSFKKNLGKNA
jgi:Zn-dependent peptidase ImmA (M78 family)/DNA-binding XRE family transcriptional regulator